MLLFSDVAQVLLPSAVYLFALLLILAIAGFRAPDRSLLRRLRFLMVALAVCTYIASAPIFSNWLIGRLEEGPAPVVPERHGSQPQARLIVALASGRVRNTVEGERAFLDEHGWNRTIAAINLWQRIGGHLMFNGGPVASDGKAAADRMAEVAISYGVPRSEIVVVRAASNTYQNITTLRDSLGTDRPEIWLVTSAIHMPRAVNVATRMGLHVQQFPCDFRHNTAMGWRAWFPHNNGPADFELALHEVLGNAAYSVRGWLAVD